MFDTLNILRGMKLRKVGLASAVALAVVVANGANAADFYFYADNMTDYLDSATSPSYSVGAANVGPSKVYSDEGPSPSGATLTAYGYDPLGTPADLLENTRAAEDLGLGVAGNGAETSQPLELGKFEVIKIDLGENFTGTNVMAWFSSIDGTEEMHVANSIYDVDTDPGLLGDPFAGNPNSFDLNWSSVAGDDGVKGVDLSFLFGGSSDSTIARFLYFKEKTDCGCTDDDVLLTQLHYDVNGTTTVSEPGTLAVFGLGAIGMVFSRRRKRANVAAV